MISVSVPGTPSSATSVSKKPVFQFERYGSLVRKNTVVKKREQEAIVELDSEKDRPVPHRSHYTYKDIERIGCGLCTTVPFIR